MNDRLVGTNPTAASTPQGNTPGPKRAASGVIARAWVDPEFKKRLLADGSAAVKELGISTLQAKLIMVENTSEVHNLIASDNLADAYYPVLVLGTPPSWYRTVEYNSRALKEPRVLLAEFGTSLPDHVQVRVHNTQKTTWYLVLPMRPSGTEGMSEAMLAELVTRDSMLGIALPKRPQGKDKDKKKDKRH